MQDINVWFYKNFVNYKGDNIIYTSNNLDDIISDIFNISSVNVELLYAGSKKKFMIYNEYIKSYIRDKLVEYYLKYEKSKEIEFSDLTKNYVLKKIKRELYDIKYYYDEILKFFKKSSVGELYENEIPYYGNSLTYYFANFENSKGDFYKDILYKRLSNVTLKQLEDFISYILPKISNTSEQATRIDKIKLETDFSYNYYRGLINEVSERELYKGKASEEFSVIAKDLSLLIGFQRYDLGREFAIDYIDKNIERLEFIEDVIVLKYLIFPFINYYIEIFAAIYKNENMLAKLSNIEEIDISNIDFIEYGKIEKNDEKLFNLINKYAYEKDIFLSNSFETLYHESKGKDLERVLYCMEKQITKIKNQL